MRVMLDIVHPAHVHFYRHLREELISDGHEVKVVSRDKEVTLQLLDRFGIDHTSTGTAMTGSLLSSGRELVHRVMAVKEEIRRFRPDIVLTRNPSGVQAARLSGTLGVFDTDDGSKVGLHFWAARPFADIITTPAILKEDFGRKHRRYKGFKALAYLHPNRFSADPTVREDLGLSAEEPLFIVRFSAYTASHDKGNEGLNSPAKVELVKLLASAGRVLISDEGTTPEELAPFVMKTAPDRMHHLLAAADLCVGDSASVAAEAALLGTPALRISAVSMHREYLEVLEKEYDLVRTFVHGEEQEFLSQVKRSLSELPALRAGAKASRERLLAENVDVTAWYRDLVYELVQGKAIRPWEGPSRRPG